MKNCKTCAHHHEVEKVKLFPGGAECTFLDGYVCTARIDFDDKVEWRVEVDDNEYCCDKYVPKKEKEKTDPIIGNAPDIHFEHLLDWCNASPSDIDVIPYACRTCSNHPSNGGSGICHCVMGIPQMKC